MYNMADTMGSYFVNVMESLGTDSGMGWITISYTSNDVMMLVPYWQ